MEIIKPLMVEDLKEGEIYTTLCNRYIFIKIGDINKRITYLRGSNYYYNASGSIDCYKNSSFSTGYRLPTTKEKEHFLQCYHAGKYVEYKEPETTDNYEIFN